MRSQRIVANKSARVLLALLVLALIVLGFFAWEPVYWWITTERVPFQKLDDQHLYRGWQSFARWGDRNRHGRIVYWYVENGFKHAEMEFGRGECKKSTWWNFDGSVRSQIPEIYPDASYRTKESPPWFWGVTDQARPTAPWRYDELRFVERGSGKVGYDVATNEVVYQWENVEDSLLFTEWDRSGRIVFQQLGGFQIKNSPPWWGDKQNQIGR